LHTEFHEVASEVLALALSGRKEEAQVAISLESRKPLAEVTTVICLDICDGPFTLARIDCLKQPVLPFRMSGDRTLEDGELCDRLPRWLVHSQSIRVRHHTRNCFEIVEFGRLIPPRQKQRRPWRPATRQLAV
jgi:hypothetical protein